MAKRKRLTAGAIMRHFLLGAESLDGWKDDKEKFKLELLEDIKNFLFGKWEKPWKASLIFDDEGNVIDGFKNIHGNTYHHPVNVFALKDEAGRSPFFITPAQISKEGGKITDKKKLATILSYIPIADKADQDKVKFMLPKTHSVINVDYVEGIKKPVFKTVEFEKLEMNQYVEAFINTLVKKKRVPVINYDQADKCFFRYTTDFLAESIHMVKINTFKNIESYYSTLFHEITHSTKNPKRCGRGKAKSAARLEYANEELVAEMGAMIICTEMGLEYSRQNSLTYLKGWLSQTKDPDSAMIEAYSYACDAAEYLLDGIEIEKLVPESMKKRASGMADENREPRQQSLFGLDQVAIKNEVLSFTVSERLIRRYLGFDGKKVTRKQVLNLNNAIHRAAADRAIRKTDPYAKTIESISRDLAETHNNMGDAVHFVIPKHLHNRLVFFKEKTVFPSVYLVKRFVALTGKFDRAKTEKLLAAIHKAEIDGKIGADDPNKAHISVIKQRLETALKTNKAPEAEKAELNGKARKAKKDNKPVSGIKEKPIKPISDPLFVPIADNTKGHVKVKKEYLKGDLGKLLGYIERYEYAILLRGDKGAGKTTLMYQIMDLFAGHGYNVGCFSLEVGKESNLVSDNRDKYIKTGNQDRVMIAEQCPNGLADVERVAKKFDVVCIDSWGKIEDAKSKDLDKLRKKYPETMFVCIFQSTTNGTARGGSAAEFDAGMVIHVHEGGRAVCEKNRYSPERDLVYLVWDQKLESEEKEETKAA